MNEHDALFHAILAAPDDDAPRLVYADWLDEHDQPERAELIRVQVEQARLPWYEPRHAVLEARGDTLLFHFGDRWCIPGLARWRQVFRRGFVEQLALTAPQWSDLQHRCLAMAPIRELWLRPEYLWLLPGPNTLRTATTQQLSHLHCAHLTNLQDSWQGWNWPNLRSLHTGTLDDFVQFTNQVACPALTHLKFETPTPQNHLAVFARSKLLHQITHLDLSELGWRDYQQRWHAADWALLLRFAPLRQLSFLSLAYQALGDAGIVQLTRNGPYPHLTELHMQANDIGAIGGDAFEQFLESGCLPNLRVFLLDGNPLGLSGARALVTWPGLRTLRRLHIRSCQIDINWLTRIRQSPYMHEGLHILHDNHS